MAGGGGRGGSGGLLHDRPGQVSPSQYAELAVEGGGGLYLAPGHRGTGAPATESARLGVSGRFP